LPHSSEVISKDEEISNLRDINSLSSIHFIGEGYCPQKGYLKSRIKSRLYFYVNEEEFKRRFKFEDYRNEVVLIRGPTQGGRNFSNMLNGYDGRSDETRPSDLI